ncbi:cytochrome C552 [Pedobacter yulinensis]|uniref:Cytochrome C552 n=1 Tax=Pedobacter yulinensis TaxID=2126353 RepID=A0A2T3HPP1_9SPHI|nr:c-type cytochrome [Pedobacter yulinensis]PST84414.1 cytochrome C552 [Pedobacter yulinensis]
MKKTIFTLVSMAAITLYACGGGEKKEQTTAIGQEEQTEATTDTSTTSGSAAASSGANMPGEKLIAKSDCIGCHNKTQKVIGPSYQDVAAKYEATDKNIDDLAGKIIKGGKGVWGEVPMTPHPTVSQDDAKEMVRYILSLKK